MARPIVQHQQKLAEKLTILNERGVGMLTRIYNIKKACEDSKCKPSFLSDKSLEPVIKFVTRKFPTVDTRTTTKEIQLLGTIKNDIQKSLSIYYNTFVELLDFRDKVCDLLTSMDACATHFDILLNYDVTKNYLELVVTYVSLMVLLSRVEDRKAVLGLYNYAYDLSSGSCEINFPRLGQMILDYENAVKKLTEEFIPHSKLLTNAVMSLHVLFQRRNLTASKWREAQMLSLTSVPGAMLHPAQTDTVPCEYLSLESMERWIIIGFMLCHQNLNVAGALEIWKQALHGGYVITLFRDEVLYVHKAIENLFESIKSYTKRVQEVRECCNYAVLHAGAIHKDRRVFLRTALKELSLILGDQPGLLGPKALFVFMALSFARDEVTWLLRHVENPAPRAKSRPNPDDYTEDCLAEMLFYIEELRGLVRKYHQVIRRYFVQYLSGYDATVLNGIVQNLTVCPEDESVILSSFINTMTSLNVKQVEMNEICDLMPLRLDWFRLQAYTSVQKAALVLQDNAPLARHLNTVTFHTKMVDALDELLIETSDLSVFCHFNRLFEQYFQHCLTTPLQLRYAVAFPMVCGHFINCTQELCPEERRHVGDRSLNSCNMFLDEMAKRAKTIITSICNEQCTLSDKLLPKNVAAFILEGEGNRKNRRNKPNKTLAKPEVPGSESYRKLRENVTDLDRHQLALTEICFAINYTPTIHVWEHVFAPREYLTAHLESRFTKALVGMVMFKPDTHEIAKPSELLNSVKAYMSVLQCLENCVNIDITRLFNNVLLQQTQHVDVHGEKTITSLYTQWYIEMLRRVSTGQIVYSENHRAFVTLPSDGPIAFNAEEYSDVNELRALAELLGPYGMRHLGENLMVLVSSQVSELKKLVKQNKDVLIQIRTNFDKPEQMADFVRSLRSIENVLQRMTIVGVILSFHSLTQRALHDALEHRIPFLLASIKDFATASTHSRDMINDLASASGLRCDVDPSLCAALRNAKCETGDDEYKLACLAMVFIAVSLPMLARMEQSQYKPNLEAHVNNSHCLAKAINSIAAALFTIHGNGDIEERLKEFLALASSSLLKLGQETDKNNVKNRDSVYLILEQIVVESPFLTMNLLESCFPYVLLRNAFHDVHKQQVLSP